MMLVKVGFWLSISPFFPTAPRIVVCEKPAKSVPVVVEYSARFSGGLRRRAPHVHSSALRWAPSDGERGWRRA